MEPLIGALDDSVWEVRQKAAEHLAVVGDLRAVPALARTLEDGYREVRFSAAEALGAIGGTKKSHRTAIRKALRELAATVPDEVAHALKTMRETSRLERLLKEQV